MSSFIFYFLSIAAIYGGLNTILRKNPVSSALHLALTMVALAGLFFNMGAQFIAGVQLIVYAGAVMVLFVMIIMLFDIRLLNKEAKSQGDFFNFLKLFLCTLGLGLLSGAVPHSLGNFEILKPEPVPTKDLARILFSHHLFLFEWIGILLLITAVGVVIVCKSEEDK